MAGLTDFKGRNLLSKPISRSAIGNPEQAGALLAVMLCGPDGQPLKFTGGGGGGGIAYVFDQADPLIEWVIFHELDAYPSVTVVDVNGNEGLADVNYHLDDPLLSGNTITITFGEPFAGKAFLN